MSKRVNGLELLLGNLDKMQARWEQGIDAAAEEIAHLLEAYAKSNHLWTPRTGNTDNSTKGTVAERTREYVLVVLSAGMEYDVFLETARQGKWAWLWPAVEANRENILKILARHLG
jgi:hypothetical protein